MLQAIAKERADSFAAKARDSMAHHGILDTPQNFWVWYTYHSGANPDLSRAIDILLSNRREFTDQTNEELFERFLGTSHEHRIIQETTERVATTLNALMSFIQEATTGTNSYEKTLRGLSRQVVAGRPITELLNVLMAETKTIEQQNHLLQQRLVNSSSVISELRKDLENVKRDALTDGLTGIPNHKLFDTTLRQSAMSVMESGVDLSLLMIDIDHFKKFNDTWGHQTGDEVLKLVAKTLAANLREGDTAARYGGEEFSAILPKATLDEAVQIGDRIRKSFETKRLVEKKTGNDIGTITVSIGAALFEPGEALSTFIERADGALYEAKHQGRNRVVADKADKKDKVCL